MRFNVRAILEKEKTYVEFFNNSTCQEMYISAEGMTEDGKVLVNE